MPGLRGTPAGTTTTSAPDKASPSPSLLRGGQLPGEGSDPVTLALVGICFVVLFCIEDEIKKKKGNQSYNEKV